MKNSYRNWFLTTATVNWKLILPTEQTITSATLGDLIYNVIKQEWKAHIETGFWQLLLLAENWYCLLYTGLQNC